MSIFINIIKDRHTVSQEAALSDVGGRGAGGAGGNFIRRPVRGIQIKDDTFATIRVVAASSGRNQLLVDAGSKRRYTENVANGTGKAGDFMEVGGKRATDIYSNFLLQQVTEERVEKQQVLETFGEAYIFLFGQRARVINFSGILANTFDFNWEAEWWYNYENFLRGTKCVENDARVYLSYDNTVVGGYIISSSASKDTMSKNHVQFQFQLFVTYYSTFSAIGDPSAFSGDASTLGILRSNQMSADLSADTLSQYRPDLVTDIPIQEGPLIGNGVVQSLFDSLEIDIAKVQDTWNQAQQVVNNVISQITGFLDPAGVRVPVGFAGSLVFADTGKLTPPSQAELAASTDARGRIRYTTFSDNVDEYIGVGDHYGGSSMDYRMSFGATTKDQELTYGQDMVREATKMWNERGYIVPPESLGAVSMFMVSGGLGMSVAGATSAWQSASNTIQAGAADPAAFALSVAASTLPALPIE